MPKGTSSVANFDDDDQGNLLPDISSDVDFSTFSFADLVNQASYVFDQGQLEKDKAHLIGVPHVITRATYYIPTMGNGYVNVQAKVGDVHALEYAIRKEWIPGVNTIDDLMFQPEESITYNDGGTGVRRQITEVLHNMGVIDVGPVNDRADFDRPWPEWQGFSQTGVQNGDGEEKVTIPDIKFGKGGKPLVIVVRHGLIFSVEPKFNKTVYYLS